MTFIIFSHGIICIVHGNDLKLCQVSVYKWQLYVGSLNNVTVLTLKPKIFLTVFLKSTCKMMSIRFLNQYIKLMSVSDVT